MHAWSERTWGSVSLSFSMYTVSTVYKEVYSNMYLTTKLSYLFLTQAEGLKMFCILTDSPEVHNFTCMTRNLTLLECSWKQGRDSNLKGDRETKYTLNGRYCCFAFLDLLGCLRLIIGLLCNLYCMYRCFVYMIGNKFYS